MFDNIMDILVPLGLSILFIFVLVLLFIIVPVGLYNEMKCLDKGYPESRTTIKLKGYCIKTFGDTTTVEPLDK